MLILDKINPELKKVIDSATDLDIDKNKIYLIELSSRIPKVDFSDVAKLIMKCFNEAGIKCVVAPKGLIKNIYELKGGDENDSRTGIK